MEKDKFQWYESKGLGKIFLQSQVSKTPFTSPQKNIATFDHEHNLLAVNFNFHGDKISQLELKKIARKELNPFSKRMIAISEEWKDFIHTELYVFCEKPDKERLNYFCEKIKSPENIL